MILLHRHRPSVEAGNRSREPSHPVSAAGRDPSGGGSPMRELMQLPGEEIRGNLFSGEDPQPGSGR